MAAAEDFDRLIVESETEGEDGRQNDQRRTDQITFDEALSRTGYGRFHYKLVALCGWTLVGHGLAFLCPSFTLTLAACEMQLSAVHQDWIHAIMVIGATVGALLLSKFADAAGRKPLLIAGLALTTVFTIAASLAPGYSAFLAFRFLVGLGIGTSLPVLYSYYAEFQPKHRRGQAICFFTSFWMLGGIMTAGLAWIIIPLSLDIPLATLTYTSWRLYMSLCMLPSLCSLLLFMLMPESPKHCIAIGKEDEAYEILESIFHENNPRALRYPVNRLDWYIECTSGQTALFRRDYDKTCGCTNVSRCLLQSGLDYLRSWFALIATPRASIGFIAVFVLLSFGHSGITAWIAHRLDLVQDFPEAASSLCAPINFTNAPSVPEGRPCHPGEAQFRAGLVEAAASLPGNIIGVLFIDTLGRKPLAVGGAVLTGASVFMVWGNFPSLVISCFVAAFYTIAHNAVAVSLIESFPTLIRCSTFGLLCAVGWLSNLGGAAAFASYSQLSCALPSCLAVVCLAAGGVLCLVLPDNAKADLP